MSDKADAGVPNRKPSETANHFDGASYRTPDRSEFPWQSMIDRVPSTTEHCSAGDKFLAADFAHHGRVSGCVSVVVDGMLVLGNIEGLVKSASKDLIRDGFNSRKLSNDYADDLLHFSTKIADDIHGVNGFFSKWAAAAQSEEETKKRVEK